LLFGALLLVYTSIHFCCYAWLLFACQLFPWSYSIVVIVIRAEVVSAIAMIVVEVIVMVETEEVEKVGDGEDGGGDGCDGGGGAS